MKQEVSNPRRAAQRYGHAIKGMTRPNHHSALPSMAGFVCIAPPKIAPLTDFEAWLASVPTTSQGGREITARMMRRIVTMRANGCSLAEVGNSIGKRAAFVRRWLRKLPTELGGDSAPSPELAA